MGNLAIERPILFSTDMVQALLAGRKTVTRRKTGFDRINEKPADWYFMEMDFTTDDKTGIALFFHHDTGEILKIKCPYGKPENTLWVRESFYALISEGLKGKYYYKADLEKQGWDFKWKPSIHMPKKAARIWLQVKSITVQRLNAITDESAIDEGIEPTGKHSWKNYKSIAIKSFVSPILSFCSLWESINGKSSLDLNPWVWVVDFEVVSTTGKSNISLKNSVPCH